MESPFLSPSSGRASFQALPGRPASSSPAFYSKLSRRFRIYPEAMAKVNGHGSKTGRPKLMRNFLSNLVGLLQDFVIGLLLVIAIGGIAGWIAGDNYGLKAILWIGGVLMAAVIYNVKTYKPESRQ